MSASIRIESGIAAGTNYWIDRPVLRVGSDPQCEICLPTADLAPHALTLGVPRRNVPRVQPRVVADRPGRDALQPGAAGVWDDGDMLVLPGDVRLVLAFDGDPASVPSPGNAIGRWLRRRTRYAPTGRRRLPDSRSCEESEVEIAAAVGHHWHLCRRHRAAAAPEPQRWLRSDARANRPSFDAIVVTSLKKGDNIRALVQKLQFAQSFIVRGHNEYAKLCFADLRDQLIRQMDSLPPADRKDAEVIRDYVEMQLGQLQ